MLGSVMLEVAIGVIFIFILVSVISSAIREALESLLKTRAAYLERGIRDLFRDADGEGLARHFYEHPLVHSLYSGEYRAADTGAAPATFARGRGLPSYIPSRNFALVLLDMAARGRVTDEVSSDPDSPRLSLDSVRANLRNIQNPAVQRVLLTALDTAGDDFDRAVRSIENWFDSGMDRVSGWYRRSTHWIIFWTALAIVAALNVDTLRIADFLYRNDAVREAVVARAETAVGDTAFLDRSYQQALDQLNGMRLPIGWMGYTPRPVPDWLGEVDDSRAWTAGAAPFLSNALPTLVGWLLAAFAATLGAPFWFDVLNKVMVIRATVKPKEKSQPESSEDRQIGWARGSEARDEALADAVAAGVAARPRPPGGGAGESP